MLRKWFPRNWRELNKRGQILVIFGLLWVAIGYGVWVRPIPTGHENLFFASIPTHLRAGAWIATGLIAIAYAWRPRRIEHDGFAFLALYVMPCERAAIFLWGWIDYQLTTIGGVGYEQGLVSALVYLVIVAAVMVCASWPNPPTNLEGEGGR
jgi:hypothetical protein